MSYSLALGPFGAPWYGSQRIVLKVTGERVSDLELRDGLNERGSLSRLPQLELPQALHLVTRIHGPAAVSYSLAFCQAVEQVCGLDVAPRAALLRCYAAELERAVSHLRAAALILDALGLDGPRDLLATLRAELLTLLARWTGRRTALEVIIPGGVTHNVDPEEQRRSDITLSGMVRRLYDVANRLISNRALLRRAVEVGALQRNAAEQYGVRGPLARGSGIARDVRIDHPYAGYAVLERQLVTQDGGDVFARLVVLLLEALESLKQASQALRDLPDGAWQGSFDAPLRKGQASSVVEGPQGILRCTLNSDGERLTQVQLDTPRQLDRLLARTLLIGALLDNVPLIVLSCDLSPAGAEP